PNRLLPALPRTPTMASTKSSATRAVREATTVVVVVAAGADAAREKAAVVGVEATAVVPAEEEVPVETRSRRSLRVNHWTGIIITPRCPSLYRFKTIVHQTDVRGVFPWRAKTDT